MTEDKIKQICYTKEEVAVVSSLGVNDTPEPTKPVEKVTAHGNTITSN